MIIPIAVARGAIDRSTSLERHPHLCGLVVFGILALRHVDLLVNPQLTWEDGRIFLAQAIIRPWYTTSFAPFDGYFIVAPKMVASLFTPLTLFHAPLIFAVFSLAVMAGSLTLPLYPSFAHIAPWPYRALWVTACVLMPWHTETFGNLGSVHWYVYYGLTLFTLADLRATSWRVRLTLPFVLLLGIFTTPNAVAIVPVLLVRLWCDRHRRTYQFHLNLLTVACIAIMVVSALLVRTPPASEGPIDIVGLGAFLVKGLGYKVVIQNLGGCLAARFVQSTVVDVAAAGAFMLLSAGLLRNAYRQDRGSLASSLILASLYYVFASMLLGGLLRPNYVTHFIGLGYYWGADRYFVIPSFYFFLLLTLCFRELHPARASRLLQATAATLYAALVIMNYRYPPVPDFHWGQQLKAYYQRLLTYPPDVPASTFSIVTYPGGEWIMQVPLYCPRGELEREMLRGLIERLPP